MVRRAIARLGVVLLLVSMFCSLDRVNGQCPATIDEKVRSATVYIDQTGTGKSTGVFVGPGKILTAHHCVSGTGTVWVWHCNSTRYSVGTVEKVDREHDLALLSIREECTPDPLCLAGSEVGAGNEVITTGWGDDATNLSVWRMKDAGVFDHRRKTDTMGRNGRSGGPVTNAKGQIVGIWYGNLTQEKQGLYCELSYIRTLLKD